MLRIFKFEKGVFFNKLFFIALTLTIIGIIFIYSAESSQNQKNLLYLKQAVSLVVGIILYYLLSKIDYHTYTSASIIIYIGGIALLLVVLIFGIRVNGAKSWISLGFFNGQLSEFAKLAYIIAFANFINHHQDDIYNNNFFLLSLVLLAPFLVLLMIEPDFGTGVIFLCIFLVMFFAGGGNPTILLFFIPIFIISIAIPFGGFVLQEMLSAGSFWLNFNLSIQQILIIGLILGFITFIIFLIYYFVNKNYILYMAITILILCAGFFGASMFKSFMKQYHYERMLVTIKPNLDPEGKGYNLNQSLISIGGGRVFGYGLTKGPQNRGGFLPANHTDFILSVLAEEWGFFGVIFVIILNVLLIYNILKIANETRDGLGFLIIIGIASLFIAHFLINVFSVVGILPIIGNPLPFLSYGGSSLVTCFMGLGIVYNINSTRYKFQKMD